jgi:hypothetical protein
MRTAIQQEDSKWLWALEVIISTSVEKIRKIYFINCMGQRANEE